MSAKFYVFSSVTFLISVGLAIWALVRSYEVVNIAQGPTGSKGDAGANGNTGAKGDIGAKGDTGAKGDIGANGNIGAKGDTGAKGDIGAKGDTGLMGPIDLYKDCSTDLEITDTTILTFKDSRLFNSTTTGYVNIHVLFTKPPPGTDTYKICKIKTWATIGGGMYVRWVASAIAFSQDSPAVIVASIIDGEIYVNVPDALNDKTFSMFVQISWIIFPVVAVGVDRLFI